MLKNVYDYEIKKVPRGYRVMVAVPNGAIESIKATREEAEKKAQQIIARSKDIAYFKFCLKNSEVD